MLPESQSNRKRIDVVFLPPGKLVAHAVKFAMMKPTQRNGELIRNTASHGARLRKPKMVGLARGATAYRAWLSADETQVMLVASAARLHGRDIACQFEALRRNACSRLFLLLRACFESGRLRSACRFGVWRCLGAWIWRGCVGIRRAGRSPAVAPASECGTRLRRSRPHQPRGCFWH